MSNDNVYSSAVAEGGSAAPENATPVAAPDLDAGAPQLRSAEEQRLNRKALVFLGGVLVLVVCMGLLVLRKGADDKAVKPVAATARAAAPALPQLTERTPPPPAELAQPIALMPPLPEPPLSQDNLFASREPEGREPDRGPSLLERRIAGDAWAVEGAASSTEDYTKVMLAALQAGNGPSAAPETVRLGPDVDPEVSNAAHLRAPDALLVRGTYLRCILETRIISDLAGYTSCLLTEPVYSINGRTLLLPKGSKIYGAYGGGPSGKRVEVIWDRITTPNGIDVAMSSPGIDGLGAAGMPGQYSAHWGGRIASALMLSLISDGFKYAAAEYGPEASTVAGNGLVVQSPYESATARSMERLAGEALSQRRKPTVTINQGTRVNVYVAKDVDFSAVLGRR